MLTSYSYLGSRIFVEIRCFTVSQFFVPNYFFMLLIDPEEVDMTHCMHLEINFQNLFSTFFPPEFFLSRSVAEFTPPKVTVFIFHFFLQKFNLSKEGLKGQLKVFLGVFSPSLMKGLALITSK